MILIPCESTLSVICTEKNPTTTDFIIFHQAQTYCDSTSMNLHLSDWGVFFVLKRAPSTSSWEVETAGGEISGSFYSVFGTNRVLYQYLKPQVQTVQKSRCCFDILFTAPVVYLRVLTPKKMEEYTECTKRNTEVCGVGAYKWPEVSRSYSSQANKPSSVIDLYISLTSFAENNWH